MLQTSITSLTEGQCKQYRRFVEDAGDKALAAARLDKKGLQTLIEHGDKLQADIVASIKKHSASDQYILEVVPSACKYPAEYKPMPIEEQVRALAQIFDLDPKRGLGFAKSLPELPEGAEGWFAVPCLKTLGGYWRTTRLVCEKLAASRPFYYREDQITPTRLRVHARTAHAMNLIAKTQGDSDILIIAAQLGLLHRGESSRRAQELYLANEFGLPSFMVGSIILTHPERVIRWNHLHMDCPGDKFYQADGSFTHVPLFGFDDGAAGYNTKSKGVRYDTSWCHIAHSAFGAATGFLP